MDIAEANVDYRTWCVEDLQLPEATFVFENSAICEALELMQSNDFSQLPVVNVKRKIVGLISMDLISGKAGNMLDKVGKCMYKFPKTRAYVIVTPATLLKDLEPLFDHTNAIFVTDFTGKFPLGVVTKFDVLKFLYRI
jgi:predicted transcriptional regulator